MNHTNNGRVITLKDLWNIFVQRIIIMAVAAAIVAVGGYVFAKVTYKPMYSSTATLYILRDQANMSSSSGEASNELTLAQKMIYDCNYLLKSRTVVEQVIKELSLNTSYEALCSRISTKNPANTRVLEVTVETNDAEKSKQIVDKLCTIGQKRIEEASGANQMNFYAYGTVSYVPSNPISVTIYLAIGLATACIIYIAFLLAYLLDDRIRNNEDIERYLGLSILGEIPNLDATQKERYGYGYGYGRKSRKYTAYTAKRPSDDHAPQSSEKKES